jgi:hypothetical protein
VVVDQEAAFDEEVGEQSDGKVDGVVAEYA